MNLWEKTLFTIAVGVIIVAAMLYGVQRLVVLRSFAELEQEYAQRDVRQALNAVSREVLFLDQLANDWAAWDDTYEFVQRPNDPYRQSNLVDTTFTGDRLNLLLIADTAGHTVWAEAFDLDSEQEIALPELSGESAAAFRPLLEHGDTTSSKSGLVQLSVGVMLVASRPILTSENEGPIRGALLMGRFMNDTMAELLSQTVQLPVRFLTADDPAAPEFPSAATSPAQSEVLEPNAFAASPIVLRSQSEQALSGYALLRDVYDQPALVLSVDLPRDIYRQGQVSFRSLTAMLGLGSLALIVAVLLLIELTVLKPIESLAQQVQAAGAAGDASRRVSLAGEDELSELAGEINTMLAGLEHSEELRLRRARYWQALGRAAQSLLVSADTVPYAAFLEIVGPAARACRASVFVQGRYLGSVRATDQLAEWSASTTARQRPATLRDLAQRLPRWEEVLQNGQAIQGRAADFPPAEQATLQSLGVESILVLPLILDHALAGCMLLERPAEESLWEADEVDLLRVAAADLAQALERQRREKLQSAIYRIAETVHRVPNLQELFGALHQIVAELMPTQNLFIALYDPLQDVLQFPYYVDEHDQPPPPTLLGHGLTEYVLRRGEPLLASPEVYADLVQRGEVQPIGAPAVDWLGVPLKVYDQTIGVLAVQSYTEGIRYRQAEKDILQFVSTQMAMAIEHMRIQDALRESEDRYRTIFQTTGAATAILEEDTRVSLANETMENLLGYSAAELQKRSWTEFVMPEDLPRVRQYNQLRRIDPQSAPSTYEFRTQDRWGHVKSVLATVGMLPGARKTIVSLLDITARKQVEDELRQLKEFNEGIVNGMAEGLLIEDERGMITFVNPALEKLLGYSATDLVGHHWQQIVPQGDWELVQAKASQRPSGISDQYETRLLRQDGQAVPVWVSARPLFRQGAYAGVLAAFTDIRALKETEEALRQAAARYLRLFEDSPISLWEEDFSEVKLQMDRWRESGVVDVRQYLQQHPEAVSSLLASIGIIDVNKASLELFRAHSKEELQQNFSALFGGQVDPIVTGHFLAIAAGATHFSGELTRYTLTGEPKLVELTWQVFPGYEDTLSRCVVSMVDITERKRAEAERVHLEAQLRQAQKMEAVGLLAGGVAHEFNNLLTVIQGNVELALSQLAADHSVARGLTAAHKAARRGTALTQQLLTFSRRQPLEPRSVDLNRVVMDLSEMVHRIIAADIQVQVELGQDLKPVLADPGGLEQMLLNLVLNARDAMPQGGLLRLATEPVTLDAAYCRTHPEAREGEHVRLTVADTGKGMDAETREHLFEPFFTTKEVGKGTGLGLSVVYGLVKQHHGSIDVQSAPGQGTRFDIYLPIA